MDKNTKTAIGIIAAVALLAAGIYFYKNNKQEEPAPLAENPIISENTATSTGATTTPEAPKNSTQIPDFIDANNTFSFDYNPKFLARDAKKFFGSEWRVDPPHLGVLLAEVIVPSAFLPGTNFIDARFTVGRSTEPAAIKGCATNASETEVIIGQTTISGYPFGKFTITSPAAGNLYETTSYRGIVDGDCYAVEYTIHSGIIGNYSLEKGVKEFDKAQIQNEMESIIKSLKFLINSD